ncbi:unnamed protein product [Thelazia callipaeda]|uniref:Voltage-dependent T-type calcium channel subunit alpha n=1 Tax=Thelazia callipaeda TaxID=103827 RepID=A0A158RD19_THECL|nr:unnamed protein product [Thelazia callipaeda]
MLQQPVSRQLRSFQSLSRFSENRGLLNRRLSTFNTRNYSQARFTEPALHCLHQAVPPRSWALRIVMNPWFDRITMLVILINCVTLGMYRPCEDNNNCTTYRCYILSITDHAIFAYFACEMIIKIVALGFYGSTAYLSDTWNRLDFFIVCAGSAEYLLQEYLGNINLTAIRTVRVLRPLRAVNRIPSMRILVNLLLDTLPMLGNVLLLCFFVFFIFGIVGVQLWAGLLRNRCVINLPKTNIDIDISDISLARYYIPEDTSLEYICSQADSSGLHTCNNLPLYTNNGVKCNLTIAEWEKAVNNSAACINWNAYYNECKVMHRNPFQGSISFDNIGFAWIAIFLVISLEGWTDIMYYVQDAHSFWNWIYFVLLIIIGAFFMINLCLVVIKISSSRIFAHLSRFRERLRQFVICNHFKRGILFAILINTLSMGVEYHQQPEFLTTVLEISNYFFTGLFALEMLLKIGADGLFGYLSDGFNLFDGGIVALSVLELFQEGKGGLSVLRTFRLLRILKLVRFMPALRYQLVVMLRTMDNVTVFFGLLVLFIFIFSILGMNLFGCKFCKNAIDQTKKCERKNFDSLLWALVTVFQILTQEDWNVVLFNGMARTTPWAALYFVALMTFGNYVLFNLLVAILVEGFQESKEEEKRQLEEEAIKKATVEEEERKRELEVLLAKASSCKIIMHRRITYFLRLSRRHTLLILPQMVQNLDSHSSSCNARQRMHSWCGMHSTFNLLCPIYSHQAVLEAYARDKLIKASQELQMVFEEKERRKKARENSLWMRLIKKTCFHRRADHSLYIFDPKNQIRIKCLQLTQKKWFDYTVLIFIAINCITLAMERPSIPPKSLERQFLSFSGYVFTVIFTIEMSMKVIANGCLFGKNAYFKDGWNILDGALVIISLMNVVFELLVHTNSPKIFGVLRVLRLLRALRPLRVINRARGVKLVVMTLISSLKPIGNIVLICCTFFIIFGILGVQLFKGTMYHCTGPSIANVTTRAECLMDPRNRWVNHRYNFDNLGQALMSLFVLASKDGWVGIMYQGIDATGVDLQPIENYNEWRMIYFISFLLLVGFFVLNMFVGVVVENFHKCKEALEAEMKEQARQKRLERRLKQQKYENQHEHKRKKRPKIQPYWHGYGPKRFFLNNVVTSKYFDLAIAAVIGINVISMAMEFYMMPSGLKYVLKALNYFFTAVFTLESAIKLVALGFRQFFSERWNQLDISIVILSISGIIFEEFEALELPINPTIIRVMRVLRIARVLKLLKMANGIRSLLDTVGEALPQVGNLGSLFFLLFFIFAALGVELFGKLECSDEHPCDGLGEHAHFKNFGMAFLTLFRIATGDNWNGIMKDALRDDCDPSDRCESNCCVDPILAPCFFIIFVLISQFVLVNVVVAVLMKHLEESNKNEDNLEGNAISDTNNEVNKSDTDGEEDAGSSQKNPVRKLIPPTS